MKDTVPAAAPSCVFLPSTIRTLDPGMGQAVAERTVLRKMINKDYFDNVAFVTVSANDPIHDEIKAYVVGVRGAGFATDNSNGIPHFPFTWEKWSDVSHRVALGNTGLCKAEDDFEGMKAHLSAATILMSGRHLQHGDENQSQRNLEVFSNCLEGSTKIATVDRGSVEIQSLEGETVLVLAGDGQMRPAKINCFGEQSVQEVSFRTVQNNGPIRHKVTATLDHRWIMADGSVQTHLNPGDRIAINPMKPHVDKEAKIHGLIFGDGSASKSRKDQERNSVSQGRSYAQIRVCDKGLFQTVIHDLLDSQGYKYSQPPHASDDRVYYLGKKPYIKDLPFTNDPEYIRGFIEGWWLADGAKAPTVTAMEISTSREDAVEWLKDYAGYAGFTITSIRKMERTETDGSYANGKPLYVVRLRQEVTWVVDSVTPAGTAKVYCPDEPVTKSFVLANGLLTGNCSTAPASFLLFYLLLNGAGVGRSYDDDMMMVNWDNAPNVRCVLNDDHADFDFSAHENARDARHKYGKGESVHWFEVPDSREGWGQAIEMLETMAFQKAYRDDLLVLDFSKVRPKGAAIGGMQNRPSSGPVPMMNALHKMGTLKGAGMAKWLQAMYVDHYAAEPVLVGGARRAARMSVKIWTDRTVLDFIRIKRPIEFSGLTRQQVQKLRAKGATPFPFLWSSNNSVGVDADFWRRLNLTPDQEGYNSELTRHAREVHRVATECAYGDGTGEPGFLNLDMLVQKAEGQENMLDGAFVGSKRYKVSDQTKIYLAGLAKRAVNKKYWTIVNPCGEIPLSIFGGYCVIGSAVPYHAETLEQAEDAFKTIARALIRVNTMDNIYAKETKRTNRIGVGQLGVLEFAWKFFKVGFRDLISPNFAGYRHQADTYTPFVSPWQVINDMATVEDVGVRAAAFWECQGQFSRSTMREAFAYSDKLGLRRPSTVTMIAPNGTISKLFALGEGWHLPAIAWYLRWVQFRHDDPLVPQYEAAGYQVRKNLKSYEGTSIVGFPTEPKLAAMGLGDKLVLAGDATPEEQYEWLRLGEFFWIEGGSVAEFGESEPRPGEARHGGQISYTLKFKPNETKYEDFVRLVNDGQPTVRACSVMPQTDTDDAAYEYLPEEPLSKADYEQSMRAIHSVLQEDIGREHVDCAGGACPITFNTDPK